MLNLEKLLVTRLAAELEKGRDSVESWEALCSCISDFAPILSDNAELQDIKRRSQETLMLKTKEQKLSSLAEALQPVSANTALGHTELASISTAWNSARDILKNETGDTVEQLRVALLDHLMPALMQTLLVGLSPAREKLDVDVQGMMKAIAQDRAKSRGEIPELWLFSTNQSVHVRRDVPAL